MHSALWYSLNCVQGSTCDQLGKIALKYSAVVGNLTRPQGGWTVSYLTELSCPRPQGGQTVSYPTELSCPGPQGGQTVSYPTELSCPGPQGGQTVSYPTD